MSQAKPLFLLQAYVLDQAIHLINQALMTGMRFEQSKSHVASKDPPKNKASSGIVKQTSETFKFKWNQILYTYRIRPALAREGWTAFLQIVVGLVWNQNWQQADQLEILDWTSATWFHHPMIPFYLFDGEGSSFKNMVEAKLLSFLKAWKHILGKGCDVPLQKIRGMFQPVTPGRCDRCLCFQSFLVHAFP